MEQSIVAWYRKDNRSIVWWGAEYPIHLEDGEGEPLYGDPDAVEEAREHERKYNAN